MAWNIEPSRSTAELKALPESEQAALTWETAQEFIAPDTLELAEWEGPFSRLIYKT